MLGVAWLLSNNKKKINLRVIVGGLSLQLVLALIILWTPQGQAFFELARSFFAKLISFSDSGALFVFGEDFRDHFYAFSITATIIFVSSLMSVLFYLGFVQKLVEGLSWVMVRVMDISGAESLCASANIFVGQTEAPLVVRPYIKSMTDSEILSLMVGGMATVTGGLLVAYTGFGADAGHLLAASFMSAPATLVIAKVMFPEVSEPQTKGFVKINLPREADNVLDAACRGASDGLKLAINVLAMLIAFIALAALINWGLSFLPELAGEEITMERLLGWFFVPFAFFMGVEWADIFYVGSFLGQKIFLNEFIAFKHLQMAAPEISERSFIISTYALCGFANFSSVAIQIGGLGALVPERRASFARLGLKAMIGGFLAANMTACFAGLLL